MATTNFTSVTATMDKPSLKTSIKATSMEPLVREVTKPEYHAAAVTLAEAFVKDHVIRYVIDTPDMATCTEAKKYALHTEVFDYIVAAHIQRGLVTTVGPNYAGVAIWMVPGSKMDDWKLLLTSGLWRLNYKFSREGRVRFFNEFLPLLARTKAEVLGPREDESYYLVYLGTKPDAQGKGYGRTLIEHITDKADQEGRPCYLESSAGENITFYQRRGFEVVRTIYLERGHERLGMDVMVREPKGQKIGARTRLQGEVETLGGN
ncbi:MAG: hypothetical protein M1824_003436 [Vezdaea acicularis]|nr:MAG: hypothetical protein M1824_003436 [Vezdaea acicularis]